MRKRFIPLLGLSLVVLLLALAPSATSFAQGTQPVVQVNLEHDWIQGFDFPLGAPLTVTVNSDEKGTTEVASDPGDGSFCLYDWSAGEPLQRVASGDYVEVSYDASTVAMTVQDVQAHVDAESDTVTGTATMPGVGVLEGAHVGVWTRNQWEDPDAIASADTTLQADGSFTADLPGLERGQKVWVEVGDSVTEGQYGNLTIRAPYNDVPALRVNLDEDWVEGDGWPYDTAGAVSAEGKGSVDTTTDPGGSFGIDGWSGETGGDPISVDDTVTATFGAETTMMVVPDFQANIDLPSATVSGTAFDAEDAPMTGCNVHISIQFEGGEEITSRDTTVQADGSYTGAVSRFALVPGRRVVVTLFQSPDQTASGNQVVRVPENRIPSMTVHLDHGWVSGSGFQHETSVTVSLDGGAGGSGEVKTQADGAFFIDDWYGFAGKGWITPGSTLVASNESTVLCRFVIPEFEASADVLNNRVTGSAFSPDGTPMADRHVSLWVQEDWAADTTCSAEGSVNGEGAFSFNLTPFDLKAGHKVSVQTWEAADGSTSGNSVMRQAITPRPTVFGYQTLTKPSTAYGAIASLSALLVAPGSGPIPDDFVIVERSTDHVNWSFDGQAQWDWISFRYWTVRPITSNAWYRLRFLGNGDCAPCVSTVYYLTSKAFLSQPNVSASPRVYRRSTLTGYLKSRHSGYTKLCLYLKSGSHWYLHNTVLAGNGNYSGYTRYVASWVPPHRGSWHVRAYHSDSSHVATWSLARYFTVR